MVCFGAVGVLLALALAGELKRQNSRVEHDKLIREDKMDRKIKEVCQVLPNELLKASEQVGETRLLLDQLRARVEAAEAHKAEESRTGLRLPARPTQGKGTSS